MREFSRRYGRLSVESVPRLLRIASSLDPVADGSAIFRLPKRLQPRITRGEVRVSYVLLCAFCLLHSAFCLLLSAYCLLLCAGGASHLLQGNLQIANDVVPVLQAKGNPDALGMHAESAFLVVGQR